MRQGRIRVRTRSFRLVLGLVVLSVLVGGAGSASADTTAQAVPFSQDWSNTGLVTTNDDWSGVAGVVGYLGDDATGNDVDPQTGSPPPCRQRPTSLRTRRARDLERRRRRVPPDRPRRCSPGLRYGGCAEPRAHARHDRQDRHRRRLHPPRHRRFWQTTPSSRSRSTTGSARRVTSRTSRPATSPTPRPGRASRPS